ncbi:hypothetical protein GW17_00055146, partial [Ensete ventricosum]
AFIVGVVDHWYLITLLCLWLTIPLYTLTMLVVLATRRAFAGGGADLTCVRSTIRPLAPPVYPAGYLRRVGHVGGPAVSGQLYDHWRPPYTRSVTCVGSITWVGQLSEDMMT